MNRKKITKKITHRKTRLNPLLQEWLEELYEEAKAKHSKLESMLKEALDSMTKYSYPLHTCDECIILKGFDQTLCTFMDKRLQVYNHNLALQQQALESSSSSSSESESDIKTTRGTPMSDTTNIENRSMQSKK